MGRFRSLGCAAIWALVAALAIGTAASDAVEGQIVCSVCWTEADRATVPYGTRADLDCAARCAEDGVPPALAAREERTFELRRIEGPPPGGGAWLPWIGSYVRVETATASENPDGVRVVGIERLDQNPWRETAAGASAVHAEPVWTDLRGRPAGIDRYRGNVVVLNFWATWCRPCLKEMPDLSRVRDRYAAYGVVLIGAAANAADDTRTVVDFVRKLEIDFPVVLGATSAQMARFGLSPALPGTVVLDEEGRVIERFAGVVKRRELEAALDRALGLDAGAAASTGAAAEVADAGTHRHGHGEHASLVPS